MLLPLLLTASTLLHGREPLSFNELSALPPPQPGIQIPYGDDPLQFGELRLPSTDGPFPVVLLIHGGCWYAEYDVAHVRPLAAAIAELGYATWTLEYRRIGNSGGAWPGTLLDIADGVDHLRQLARDYPLDLSKVIAMGHSAGGQLALWLAARQRIASDSELYRAAPLAIQGVIGLAAAADLNRLAAGGECGDAAKKFLDGGPLDWPQRYQQASPHHLAPLGVPQILIDGAADKTWSPIAESYYQAAVKAGDEIRRIVVDDAGHFDLVAPQPPVWPHLRNALDNLLSAAGDD
ncbi:MAG: alpha/beta hydrolase [Wenzhouxiangellaceae bacterium]